MISRRCSRRWAGICVLAIAVVGGAITALADERFDSTLWQSTDAKRNGIRIGMVDDLLARDLLAGRTGAEVEALLGPPEQTAYFANWDMVYWLGSEQHFISIDSEWLVLRFGPNDRVAEVRVVTD